MRRPTIATAALLALVAPLATAVPVAAGDLPAAALRELAREHVPASYPLLRDALAIPNDAHDPEQVEANVRWAERTFGERGFATRRLDTGGPPLLLAERPSPGAARTLLVYLQIDGQPVDPAAWSQEDPYRAVLERPAPGGGWQEVPWGDLAGVGDPDWRIFARSSSDAKGPVVMFLTALDALDGTGVDPTWSVKVVMDFEEELGSPHLPAAVARHRQALAADALLIFDGPLHATNRPTLSFGARGIATATLTVFGPRSAVHSGHYGNWVPNPAERLARLLASLKDGAGRVTLAGWYDGVEIDDEARRLLAATPDDEEAMLAAMGVAGPSAVAPTYQQALQYPSLNVRGMASAWIGPEVRTLIPATATAELDVRLVPEVPAERLHRLLVEHLESRGWHLLGDREPTDEERRRHPKLASFTWEKSYDAFRTPYDSEVGVWLASALERAFGETPVRIRMMGGSIPISPFVVELGIPAVAVPTVNPDNNQHAPDENLRLGNYLDGVVTYLAVLTEPFGG